MKSVRDVMELPLTLCGNEALINTECESFNSGLLGTGTASCGNILGVFRRLNSRQLLLAQQCWWVAAAAPGGSWSSAAHQPALPRVLSCPTCWRCVLSCCPCGPPAPAPEGAELPCPPAWPLRSLVSTLAVSKVLHIFR